MNAHRTHHKYISMYTQSIYINVYVHIYRYLYLYVGVCVCVWGKQEQLFGCNLLGLLGLSALLDKSRWLGGTGTH